MSGHPINFYSIPQRKKNLKKLKADYLSWLMLVRMNHTQGMVLNDLIRSFHLEIEQKKSN
jgi:hypothetical protein